MRPFDEGYLARSQGLGEDENPYHPSNEREHHLLWLDGWVEARLEEEYISSEEYDQT